MRGVTDALLTGTKLAREGHAGRAFEAVLRQGGPWDEADRLVAGAIHTLNDYVGYRPTAVLASGARSEPYARAGSTRRRGPPAQGGIAAEHYPVADGSWRRRQHPPFRAR